MRYMLVVGALALSTFTLASADAAERRYTAHPEDRLMYAYPDRPASVENSARGAFRPAAQPERDETVNSANGS